MDLVKIGTFLSTLRHEKNLTQEELGSIIGVTNKTISRWENGNYLPPVEMLQILSNFYEVSINEILSGERLTEHTYKEKAEENIKTALRTSAFTVREKIHFFKRKWLKDHLFDFITAGIAFIALFIAGICLNYHDISILALILAFLNYFIQYNRMMTYVEQRAYDGTGTPKNEDGN